MNSESNARIAPLNELAVLRGLAEVLLPVALATALADFLFWDSFPGASLGVFFAGLGLLIFLRHPAPMRVQTWLLVTLLGATCAQSAIELSLSNFVAAMVLTLALAGDAFQSHLTGWWARFSEALYGLLTAPTRWLRLGAMAGPVVRGMRNETANVESYARFGLKVLAPAGVLLFVFGLVFVGGNAAFRGLLEKAHHSVFGFWSALEITPLRIIGWALFATVALGFLHGTAAPAEPRWWTRTLPRVPRSHAKLACWQTGLALLAMNALFFTINTLDAVFLWSNGALPTGVSHSEFVHSGVNSLITAVVMSAIVIAGMFQQSEEAVSGPWLKHLAHIWVLQNLVLIAGVAKRLVLYADVYQLTEKRVYVGCFLGLVTAGFVLLAWFVQRRSTFNWLLGSNLVAALTLFFVLQFLDVAGWVARYNVSRWQKGATLDIEYLASLGTNAWPELIVVAKTARDPALKEIAHSLVYNINAAPKSTGWRSYQWREAEAMRQITAYATAR